MLRQIGNIQQRRKDAICIPEPGQGSVHTLQTDQSELVGLADYGSQPVQGQLLSFSGLPGVPRTCR